MEKKRKWYLISKEFAIGLIISLLIYFSGYIYYGVSNSFSYFYMHVLPAIPIPMGKYTDSDFAIIARSFNIPQSEVDFFKIKDDDKLKETYHIMFAGSGINRPSFINNALYFPRSITSSWGRKVNYITIFKAGRMYRKNIGGQSREFITEVNGRIFIDVDGAICVFNKDLKFISRILPPKKHIFLLIYQYRGKIYALESYPDGVGLCKIDPFSLKIESSGKYPFFVCISSDANNVKMFNGTVYMISNGAYSPEKRVIYHGGKIYRLTDKITPVYTYPDTNDKKHFTFQSFIPVNPTEGKFVLPGEIVNIQRKEADSYLYFTDTKKFVKIPEKIVGSDSVYYGSGIYIKNKIYIVLNHRLISYDGKAFAVVKKFKIFFPNGYDPSIFLLHFKDKN